MKNKVMVKENIITPVSVGKHVEEEYRKSKDFRKAYEEEVLMLNVAYKIAQLRKQRHMTQRDLARMTGTTQQTISRLEDSSNAQITLHTLTRVARALKARLSVEIIPQ